MPDSTTEREGFGVYVHWPFCLSKCPYCDFNSHVRHTGIDEARYVRAFAAEIATTAARAPGRTVTTIFFGGGTPSLMKPATVGAILDAIGKHWTVAPDAEVTLEANPTSVEATRFRGLSRGGRQSRFARRAGARRCLAERTRPIAHRAGSARRREDRARGVRALFVRPDLRAARPDARAWRAELLARHRRSRRASLALSTHDRAGHAVCGAACERQADDSRRRQCARALRRHAGNLGRARTARIRDFQPCAARARSAGTISSTGAITNMPASGRARMGG